MEETKEIQENSMGLVSSVDVNAVRKTPEEVAAEKEIFEKMNKDIMNVNSFPTDPSEDEENVCISCQ